MNLYYFSIDKRKIYDIIKNLKKVLTNQKKYGILQLTIEITTQKVVITSAKNKDRALFRYRYSYNRASLYNPTPC